MVDQRQQQAPERQGAWSVPGPDRRSLTRAITGLGVPMAAADVFGLLVLVGIVALMARMSAEALYVRALYVPLVNLFAAVYAGIGISNQVAAAISRGSGKPRDVVPLAASFARVWLAVSAVLIVVVVLIAPALGSAFGVAAADRDTFISFVRWMAPAELAQVGAVLCASSLRGFGRAGAGSAVSLVTGVVQFVGVAVFGLGLHGGIFTVPASLAAGSLVGLLLGGYLLLRADLWPERRLLTWRPEVIGHLMRVGLPVASTQLLLFGGNFGLLWILGRTGPDVVSGFSAAATLQTLLIMPGIVLGSAIAIVLNQQRGAGKAAWMSAGLDAGMRIGFGLYAVLALLVWVLRGPIGDLMSGDPKVAAVTSAYLGAVGLTYVVQGPVLTALACMEQLGAGFLALALNVFYFVVIVVIGWLVVDPYGAVGVFRGIGATNLIGISVVVTAFIVVRRMSRAAPSKERNR
jgi:Na+-driven multidrug efflux pump